MSFYISACKMLSFTFLLIILPAVLQGKDYQRYLSIEPSDTCLQSEDVNVVNVRSLSECTIKCLGMPGRVCLALAYYPADKSCKLSDSHEVVSCPNTNVKTFVVPEIPTTTSTTSTSTTTTTPTTTTTTPTTTTTTTPTTTTTTSTTTGTTPATTTATLEATTADYPLLTIDSISDESVTASGARNDALDGDHTTTYCVKTQGNTKPYMTVELSAEATSIHKIIVTGHEDTFETSLVDLEIKTGTSSSPSDIFYEDTSGQALNPMVYLKAGGSGAARYIKIARIDDVELCVTNIQVYGEA